MEKEIKCPFCSGVAVLEYDDLILDNGKIIIKNEPNYKCKKCKQEFCTSKQMFHLDKLLHDTFLFKRNIIVAGKSLAVTLPSDVVSHYNLKKGDKVSILAEPKAIKIKFD